MAICSLCFMGTRVNVVAEHPLVQEALQFFSPHFEVHSQKVEMPHATIVFRSTPAAAHPNSKGQKVWLRRSHSKHFLVLATRYEETPVETVICEGTKTRVDYDRDRGQVVIFVNPATRRIELIELIRDLVLKNVELNGTLILHASVVTNEKETLLLVGKKGAGKTTVALELVHNHGYHLVSGDKALVRLNANATGLEVCGWPDWPNVGLGTLQQYPALARELGLTRHIAEVSAEQLWSVAQKVPVEPRCLARHFQLHAGQQALNIDGVFYPRIGADEASDMQSVSDHFAMALPHLERAFHSRSDWNHFVTMHDRKRTETLCSFPALWNKIPAYSLEGKGKLGQVIVESRRPSGGKGGEPTPRVV